MHHRIIQADVHAGLIALEPASVHTIITSPPYWGLRDYLIDGQIGLEPTPGEYLAKLIGVFRMIRRVLRNDGSLWLNIGDSYANDHPRGYYGDQGDTSTGSHGEKITRDWSSWGLKRKDLVGMPWRLALALQEDGWYLRTDIVWAKPNPMRESVRDRPVRSHEFIFLLSKKPRYYYDQEPIREATGGNRKDVWTITPAQYKDAHFATFPEELVRLCILAGTSERACPACGAPWWRSIRTGEPDKVWRKACGGDCQGEYTGSSHKYNKQDALGKQTYTGFNARWKKKQQNASDVKRRILKGMLRKISTWSPGCTCGRQDTVPCTVLDPFAGTGTVAKVARDLGRSSVMIEISPEYIRQTLERCRFNQQLETGAYTWEVEVL